MKHDAINVAALIVITSFVVERVTSGLLFLLSFLPGWQRILPDPGTVDQTVNYAKRQKLVYYGLAGTIVLILVLSIQSLFILNALNIEAPLPLDLAVSWLVLVAGSDRIFDLLGAADGGAPQKGEARPLSVTGTLTVEPEAKKTTAGAPR